MDDGKRRLARGPRGKRQQNQGLKLQRPPEASIETTNRQSVELPFEMGSAEEVKEGKKLILTPRESDDDERVDFIRRERINLETSEDEGMLMLLIKV